jgi:hypothetical protein
MFVRFQQRKSDGRRPGMKYGYWPMLEAKLACKGKCGGGAPGFIDPSEQEGVWRQRGLTRKEWHCPAKPRCRWRVGATTGLNLIPYTLHVSLVESYREGGKPRHEHLADLGSIEGEFLPGFWADADPAAIRATFLVRAEHFFIGVHLRADYWARLDERLARLTNRITPEDAASIRDAIDARIPRPTAAELREITVWCAKYGREF